MGSCSSSFIYNSAKKKPLSLPLRNKVLEVFHKMDIDGSKSIDKTETVKFWYIILILGNLTSQRSIPRQCTRLQIQTRMEKYQKMNGLISGKQLSDVAIPRKKLMKRFRNLSQIENMLKGGAWVYFDKVPTDAQILKKMMAQQNRRPSHVM